MLELVGIIAGIVAATSILLFGSRGVVDLLRGLSERRKRVDNDSSPTGRPTAAVPSQATAPITTEKPPSTVANIAPIPTSRNFVGRQRELGVLRAALEDAAAGRGRVMMLAGEAGIGKTRMLEELAAYAATTGSQVLWGRCYEDSGAPPLWPWIEVIRARVQEATSSHLRQAMGTGAGYIAEIVPEIRTKLPNLAVPPKLDPEQDRFRLFDSMTTFLANDSLSQPLVIALEDLHWADTSSLKMLGFLGSRVADSHLMVVGAYRDGEIIPEHPFSQTLAALSSEPSFRLETLRRFGAEDTGSLIESTGGLQPTEELIQRIQRHTDGNPLFVGEVVRLLDERGELESAEPGLAVPESVRAVTRQRLRSLSAECNRTLNAASIIGREFDLGLLRLLFPEAAANEVSDALEEAVGARLVEELQPQPGRYQFTHSLVQQALTEELSVSARARMHADIAVSLEIHYGTEADTQAAELAYHFAEAQTIVGTGRLVHYLLLAGERAINSHAYEDAIEHFQRGLSAKEGNGAQSNGSMDDETAALLDGLGRTQLAMLQVDEGWANLTRAFDHYAEVGDIPHAVAIAEYPVSVTSPGIIAPLLARALEMVPPDSYEAGRLLPWHGRLLNVLDGDYEGAQEALDRALAIAQREGDTALEVRTLAMGADVEAYQFHYRESRQKALRAIELGRNADDPLSDMLAHMYAGTSLTVTGVDGEEARKHFAANLAAAERLGDRSWLSVSQAFTGARYIGWGDWQRARELSDSSLELAPEGFGIVIRAQLEYQLGNFREGELYLERMLENIRATPPEQSRSRNISMNVSLMVPLSSRITGVADRFDVAEEVAQTILSSKSFPPGLAIHATIGLALMAVQRHDVSAAAEQYSALESHRGTMQTVLLPWVSIDRLLGLLAHTMGNTGQAVTHFEDALNFCRNAGYLPELAWSCYDYADLLLERDSEGDRAQASSLLDESLEIATNLGMRPLIERVTSRQKSPGI